MCHAKAQFVSLHVSHALVKFCVILRWAAVEGTNNLRRRDGVWVVGPVFQRTPTLSYHAAEKTWQHQRDKCWNTTRTVLNLKYMHQ